MDKFDKAADKLDTAKAAIPKKKVLTKERPLTKPQAKQRCVCILRNRKNLSSASPPKTPLSRPAQEAGIFVHNKIHSVEKDNSSVEGAHKSEEAAERLGKYGGRKVKQGYRSHKLKPYRAVAKAEKTAAKANVNFQYHKTLSNHPWLANNPASRLWQKQQIKWQYAKAARPGGAKGIRATAGNVQRAAGKAAKMTRQTAVFVVICAGLSSCGAMFSGTLNGVLGTSYTSEDSDLKAVENA